MLALLRRHFVLVLLAVPGVLLVAAPQLDLAAAGLFYDPFDGFFLRNQPFLRFVFDLVPWISRAIVIALLVFVLLAWTWQRRQAFFLAHRKATLFLLLVALVGPLLLVNGVFKEHWGRARPSQIEQFGGSKQFTRAAIPADQCAKNCSFVSGHASSGFFFLAPAFVFATRRRMWLAVGTSAGLGIGLVRMMQGGHFLSDVLFTGVVVYLTALLLQALLYRASPRT
jgi:lipid A 4'-phosphatase